MSLAASQASTSSSSSAVVRAKGTVVAGKYRLEKRIGQGAAGEVWLATHETIGKPVAIKLLRTDSKGRSAIRFVQEACLAAQVSNRYVVNIFDFGNAADGTLYMVMEHLYGETLGARLARQPPVKVSALIAYACQVLTGLEAVHRLGIVHRDLKPENIFLVEEGGEVFPKVLDFGVSRTADPSVLGPEISKLTATGMTVGTPLFMAPEQARGLRDLDARSDIYSMGVILFKAFSGEAPFAESNVLDLLMAVVNSKEAPALVDLRPDLGSALSDVVRKAMCPDREKRFADATEMRHALMDVAPSLPGDALCEAHGHARGDDSPVSLSTVLPATDADPTTPANGAHLASPRSRHLRVGIAAALGLAAAGLVAAVLLSRPDKDHDGMSPAAPTEVAGHAAGAADARESAEAHGTAATRTGPRSARATPPADAVATGPVAGPDSPSSEIVGTSKGKAEQTGSAPGRTRPDEGGRLERPATGAPQPRRRRPRARPRSPRPARKTAVPDVFTTPDF